MNMLYIPYETEGFPPNTVPNGSAKLAVTWDDITWSAMTVGRPDRYAVSQHGSASLYEALFRWSLVKMALERHGGRLCRTNAAKTLDPTEKGAVSYFLGMTFCKLFATKLLHVPWLLHLDVCRPELDPVLTGRSRPDLVGQDRRLKQWYGFECKGRVSPPDAASKDKAKSQAQRLVSVNKVPCSLHIGAVTYFHYDLLCFYWRDPYPEKDKIIEVDLPSDAWRHYYRPVAEIMGNRDRKGEMGHRDSHGSLCIPIEGYDLKLFVHHKIREHLDAEEWEGARKAAVEAEEEINRDGYQPDGLLVRTGESWH